MWPLGSFGILAATLNSMTHGSLRKLIGSCRYFSGASLILSSPPLGSPLTAQRAVRAPRRHRVAAPARPPVPLLGAQPAAERGPPLVRAGLVPGFKVSFCLCVHFVSSPHLRGTIS